MDEKHLEQIAIWVADNLAPIERADMPSIFYDDEDAQERLWDKVCEIMRYKD